MCIRDSQELIRPDQHIQILPLLFLKLQNTQAVLVLLLQMCIRDSSDSEETQETLAQTETGTTAETAPMAFEGESAGSVVGSGMAGTREPAVESSQSCLLYTSRCV